MSLRHLAGRVDTDQVGRDVARRAASLGLGPLPLAASESAELGFVFAHAHEALHAPKLVNGYVKAAAFRVFQQQVLPLAADLRQHDDPLEAADTVFHVDYVIADLQI